MTLALTLANRTLASGGPVPNLADYNVFASASTSCRFELLNGNGQTIAVGTITVTSTSRALGYLIVAALGASTLWEQSAGCLIVVDGAGPICFNTSGSNTDGSSPTLAPDANSIGQWTTGNSYSLGWVS